MARKIARFCDKIVENVSDVTILNCNPYHQTPVLEIKKAVFKIITSGVDNIHLLILTNDLPQEKVSEIKSFLEGRNFEII